MQIYHLHMDNSSLKDPEGGLKSKKNKGTSDGSDEDADDDRGVILAILSPGWVQISTSTSFYPFGYPLTDGKRRHGREFSRRSPLFISRRNFWGKEYLYPPMIT